ncbi:hypothetical protein [Streptosporangium saharense]|uniref:hypothetical protein n=1 Tax=Streptosporangium saharense TaxID=1706840 RepID=UPI0033186FB7
MPPVHDVAEPAAHEAERLAVPLADGGDHGVPGPGITSTRGYSSVCRPMAPYSAGAGTPQALADDLGGAWTAFARDGAPPADWPRFDLGDRWTRLLDVPCSTKRDPSRPLRRPRAAAGLSDEEDW